MSLTPAIEYIKSFNVTGLSVRTQNRDEFDKETAKLPTLWQQFYSSEVAIHSPIFGVYSDYDSDANGYYTATVGITSSNAPPQWTMVVIHPGKYLAFHAEGPMPTTVIETWKQIWTFFETQHHYKRNFLSDFEAYNGSDRVTIYIGIE